jgi:hypothetical protein
MNKDFPAFLAVFAISFQFTFSQNTIHGNVVDQQSGESLPFVNIVYNSRGYGIVSNMDGRFSLALSPDVEFLKFSYLGYNTFMTRLESVIPNQDLIIQLEPKAYDISEVTIKPGVNPAHRIILKTLENRDQNNPEQMKSFSYRAYNKMYFTMLFDTLQNKQKILSADSMAIRTEIISGTEESSHTEFDPADSSLDKTMDFFEKQHLFLMEFVSEREFLYPDKNKEVVTASRVSGLKDPSFTLLATQLQSFAFYDDLIMIWDKKYINPISRGSTSRYLFILEDTLFTERNDTLFVISFRPLRGKNFDGLMGILHINTNGYAIQDVIAEAAEQNTFFSVGIRQKYEWIENQQWFPVELNTDFILSADNMNMNGTPVDLTGVGKSYLSDIVLNPELNRRDFGPVVLEVQDDAHKKKDEEWTSYRVVPLTAKDTNTYKLIDSLGREANLDRSVTIAETMASGYIPWGFLDINYRSLINYNRYEGFRLGMGLQTNRKLSKWFSIGGHFAWGTNDRDFKYGGHLKIYFDPFSETFIQYKYNNDVMESAGIKFLLDIPLTSSEIFRGFLIANKDIVEENEIMLGSSLIPYLHFNLFLNQSIKQVTTDYSYQVENEEPASSQLFHFTELGARMRFAYKEKFMETPRGSRISLGTDYPVVNLNVIKGIHWLQGEYDYLKLEARVSKTFITKTFGNTNLTLSGGIIDHNIPYPNIYSGYGSYGVFVPEVQNSFATMRMNEFVMDQFAFAFLQQDLGNLIFNKGKFRPEIVIVTNAGYGDLIHTSNHENMELKTIHDGYYESGILIENLLRQWFLGYGIGVIYRYGPYSLNKTIDNFAFKFTVSFNL